MAALNFKTMILYLPVLCLWLLPSCVVVSCLVLLMSSTDLGLFSCQVCRITKIGNVYQVSVQQCNQYERKLLKQVMCLNISRICIAGVARKIY